MRIIILFVFFLTLIFQHTTTKADDISDFEIEGISVGDSLLDHYSKNQINNAIEIYNYPGGNKFIYYFLEKKNYEKYRYIQVHVDPLDTNFTVESIEGHISYKNNILECYDQMKIVKKDLESVLNIKGNEDSGNHPGDKSGNSKLKRIMFDLQSGGYVEIICYDMSKKLEKEGYTDRFVVGLSSKALMDFLTYNAY